MRTLLRSTTLAATLSMMSAVAFAQANTNRGGTPGFNPDAGQATSSPAAELVEMNNAEVALGKTAASKAQNAEVKSFANMMVKEHSAALTKLRDVEGVTTTEMKPNAKHQATADRLSKLSGAEFDREYISAMVTDHEEALSFLERQSKTNSGASSSGAGKKSLAKVSEDMIPTVREHLQQAQKIQKDLGGNSQSSSSGTTRSNTNTNSNSGAGNTNSNRGTTTPAPAGNR